MNNSDRGEDRAAKSLHDLLQPLTAIDNYARTGHRLCDADKYNPAETAKLFARICEQTQRMKDICQELRALREATLSAPDSR